MHSTQRTRLLLPIAILFIPPLAGCGDSPAQPSILPGASAATFEPGEGRPFYLRAEAIVLEQAQAPDFGPPLFGRSDFEGRCSEPSDLLTKFQLWGEATHLGRYIGIAEHCTRIDFQTMTAEWSDGESVFIAANGDELHDSYAGSTPGPGEGFDDERHVFEGGTGRFADASGEAIAVGRCDMATGTCALEMSGFISY